MSIYIYCCILILLSSYICLPSLSLRTFALFPSSISLFKFLLSFFLILLHFRHFCLTSFFVQNLDWLILYPLFLSCFSFPYTFVFLFFLFTFLSLLFLSSLPIFHLLYRMPFWDLHKKCKFFRFFLICFLIYHKIQYIAIIVPVPALIRIISLSVPLMWLLYISLSQFFSSLKFIIPFFYSSGIPPSFCSSIKILFKNK